MNKYELEYNSLRENLIIPEYGRHVQQLVNYTKTIEDPLKRQLFAERLIYLLQQMNPQSKNLSEYREKLWKHLFRIAGYDLDVKPPEDIDVRPVGTHIKPEKLNYPRKSSKYRHYGKNVITLINKAIEMEDGPKKDAFVVVIGSYMKLAYKNWNKEHYVNDEIIKEDLKSISEEKLMLPPDMPLDFLYNSTRRTKRPAPSSNKSRMNKNRRRKP